MSLYEALQHLHPGAIASGLIGLRDDSDGNGPYIDFFDGSLGTQPSQAELDQAEIDYRPASYLAGGERDPDAAEIDAADIALVSDYFMFKTSEYVNAGGVADRYFKVEKNEKTGELERVPDINLLSKYTRDGGRFQVRARLLEAWVVSVWEELENIQAEWLASTIPTPTWTYVLTRLPVAP